MRLSQSLDNYQHSSIKLILIFSFKIGEFYPRSEKRLRFLLHHWMSCGKSRVSELIPNWANLSKVKNHSQRKLRPLLQTLLPVNLKTELPAFYGRRKLNGSIITRLPDCARRGMGLYFRRRGSKLNFADDSHQNPANKITKICLRGDYPKTVWLLGMRMSFLLHAQRTALTWYEKLKIPSLRSLLII